MSATGYATFDTTLAKTNGILKQVEQAYNWPRERRNRSYNALRAVLHAVRDRLTVEEAAQVMGISLRTAMRDWEYARAWLVNEMDRLR